MKKLSLITVFVSLLCLSMPTFAAQPDVSVDVKGLVCDFCAKAIEKVFLKEKDVESVRVNLKAKNIALFFKKGGDLDDALIHKLVKDSGYDVVKINRPIMDRSEGAERPKKRRKKN